MSECKLFIYIIRAVSFFIFSLLQKKPTFQWEKNEKKYKQGNKKKKTKNSQKKSSLEKRDSNSRKKRPEK